MRDADIIDQVHKLSIEACDVWQETPADVRELAEVSALMWVLVDIRHLVEAHLKVIPTDLRPRKIAK